MKKEKPNHIPTIMGGGCPEYQKEKTLIPKWKHGVYVGMEDLGKEKTLNKKDWRNRCPYCEANNCGRDEKNKIVCNTCGYGIKEIK